MIKNKLLNPPKTKETDTTDRNHQRGPEKMHSLYLVSTVSQFLLKVYV